MSLDGDSRTSAEKRTLSQIIIGPARDVKDPEIFHQLSLIAFLAWVGLGSDGLSSSCYGPEEAFLALGTHQYMAVFLAMLMALTVFIISASYSQTIDEVPTGKEPASISVLPNGHQAYVSDEGDGTIEVLNLPQ